MDLRNKILTAALVLQVAALALVFWPEAPPEPPSPLLAGVTQADITSITVSDPRDRSVVVARGGEGCVIPTADDFPCNTELFTALIDKVVEVNTGNLVTKTTDSHRRLQVHEEDFQRLLEIELSTGSRHRLYLGSSPRLRAVHVRADDQSETYVTPTLSTFDAPPDAKSWIETNYFTIPEREVVAVTLENSNGRFQLSKDEEGNWSLAGLEPDEELRQVGVDALLNRATRLEGRRPLGKTEQESYGLEEPQASVTVTTSGEQWAGGEYTIHVGAVDPVDTGLVSRIVKYSDSPYYMSVASYIVAEFTDKEREDFIVQPPADVTPTPQASP